MVLTKRWSMQDLRPVLDTINMMAVLSHFLRVLVPIAAAGPLMPRLTVGPLESITRISDAARLAKDGDVVLIQPGTYRGDVAVAAAQPEIRVSASVRCWIPGQRRGKVTWVFAGGRFRVTNIDSASPRGGP